MTARCPVGHGSTELDYCSVCGAAMTASSTAASAPRPAAVASGACPACSEPRVDPDARFCEVCRYDFVAGKPGPAPRSNVALAAAAPAPPPPLSVAAKSAPSPPAAPAAYALVVQIDPALDVDPDPSQTCPAGSPDVTVDVDRSELLVGRRDDLRDVHPDIPLSDPGTSRRHAKFVKSADGSLALVDLASTNGTKLNGVDVAAGSRSPLHVGDEVTLGRWTRIRVAGKS